MNEWDVYDWVVAISHGLSVVVAGLLIGAIIEAFLKE